MRSNETGNYSKKNHAIKINQEIGNFYSDKSRAGFGRFGAG
jgi:hypothetical protein